MLKNKYLLECAVWELTLRCNLKCIHCGSSAGTFRKDELNTEEALKLCEDLKEANCLSIALMGGEPFLRKDFWQIAEKIKSLGMDFSVITNGTLFNENIFKRLKELSPKAVAVSIDGASKETHEKIRGVNGCYERSWRFINYALKEDLPVSIITTVSRLNIKDLKPLSEQIRNKNIAWQIQTAGSEGIRFPKELLLDREEFYSVGMFIDNLRKKYSIKEMPVIGAHDLGYNSIFLRDLSVNGQWTGCQAGISVLGIRSNGDFLGCLSLNNDNFIEGNAKKIKIKDLWENENSFVYTRKFKKEQAGPNCKNCLYIEKCKGGCCEMSLMKTGQLHNDYYCFYKIEQEFMKKNIFNKIFFKFISFIKNKKNKNLFELKQIFLGKRK